MTPLDPGRFTRAAIHSEAGEVEVRLSPTGNWQLNLRAEGEQSWRMACSGDLTGGALAPHPLTPDEPQRFGVLVIDRATRRVFVSGTEVGLTDKRYELLLALASQPDRIFTKAELMRKIWGWEMLPSSHTLECHAGRLRRQLRSAGADGFIVNRHGVGYRLWNGVELAGAVS